jgi:ribosomal protein S18 acetylase RimI-like enzyme
MPYKITPADKMHFNGIVDLFCSAEELFMIYPSASWPFDIAQLQQLSRLRTDLTVVLDGELIIGFANLYRNLSGDRIFVGNVVISGAYRGIGLGRQLVCHMCDIVFEHYAKEVHITVFNHNTPALMLYTSLGFKPYDLERRLTPEGKPVMAIHMRLNRRSWHS